MALNPEIALQVQAPNLGVLGQGFGQGQQMMAAQNQLHDARIQRHAQESLRNTLANVDVNDPDAPNKIRQWMAGAGHADVGEQYAQQLEQYNNQRYEALQKQSAEFTTRKMALAANAAEKARMETDPAKAQAHLDQGQRDIEALEKYYPGLQKYSPKLFDNSDYPKAGDINAIRALSIQNMPADQQRKARFGFGVEDVSKQLEAGKPVAPVPQAGPQNPNGPALQPIQQQPQPYLPQEKLQIYSQLRANAPDEESRKLVESKMDDVKAQMWKETQPKLNALLVPPVDKKGNPKGWTQATKAYALDKAYAAVPDELKDYPAYKQWALEHAKEQVNPQVTIGMLSNVPPSPQVIDNAIKRIANHESTVAEEMNKGWNRSSPEMAASVHDQLVEGVKKINPDFSEADSESGYGFAKNQKTKTAISQLDNAYSTVAHLKDIYSKLDNTQFPTINKAINAGKFESGSIDAAKAAIGEVLGNDELTRAFAGGVSGTNKLRDLSAKLADKNLSPQQMLVQFDEVLQGVDRSRQAFENQGGGYVKPPKYRTQTATAGQTAPKIIKYDAKGNVIK